MTDATFREPVKREAETLPKIEPVEQTTTTWGEKTPDIETPIALYQEMNGVPYTARFYEIVPLYNDPTLGMREEVDSIEQAYRQKVQFNELKDGKDTFKDFIKQAEKATDCEKSPTNVKIAKIAQWVKFMAEMDKIDKERVRYANT